MATSCRLTTWPSSSRTWISSDSTMRWRRKWRFRIGSASIAPLTISLRSFAAPCSRRSTRAPQASSSRWRASSIPTAKRRRVSWTTLSLRRFMWLMLHPSFKLKRVCCKTKMVSTLAALLRCSLRCRNKTASWGLCSVSLTISRCDASLKVTSRVSWCLSRRPTRFLKGWKARLRRAGTAW